jgi:hypothetical protein
VRFVPKLRRIVTFYDPRTPGGATSFAASAGHCNALDEPGRDRIGSGSEHDRNLHGGPLGRASRGCTNRHDHVDLFRRASRRAPPLRPPARDAAGKLDIEVLAARDQEVSDKK